MYVRRAGLSVVVEVYADIRTLRLVDYANEVFVPTFAGTLSPNQVTLEPKRTEKSKATAVACWRPGGSNLARRANDIAFGIQQLIDDGYEERGVHMLLVCNDGD